MKVLEDFYFKHVETIEKMIAHLNKWAKKNTKSKGNIKQTGLVSKVLLNKDLIKFNSEANCFEGKKKQLVGLSLGVSDGADVNCSDSKNGPCSETNNIIIGSTDNKNIFFNPKVTD